MKIQLIKDINRLIEGWKKYAPTEKFAGISVEQFEVKFNDLLELLRVMEVIRSEYCGKIARREGLAGAINVLYQQIVDSIKGHKDFGRWSEFYRFLGYKTPDEKHPSTKTGEAPDGSGPEEGDDTPDNPPEGGTLPQAA